MGHSVWPYSGDGSPVTQEGFHASAPALTKPIKKVQQNLPNRLHKQHAHENVLETARDFIDYEPRCSLEGKIFSTLQPCPFSSFLLLPPPPHRPLRLSRFALVGTQNRFMITFSYTRISVITALPSPHLP